MSGPFGLPVSHTPARHAQAPPLDALQAAFLAILPRIQAHGEVVFRWMKCSQSKEDAVAEMTALCWKWYLNALEDGKDLTEVASGMATLAARAVRCGRRLAGSERAREVMSPVAQRRHGFEVERLAEAIRRPREHVHGAPHGQDHLGSLEECLRDNSVTPPPDQAAFRIDFPRWLSELGERKRVVAEDLMAGDGTGEVAGKRGVSPGRVSQLRREMLSDWLRFHGEHVTDWSPRRS
jgi:hypothetical protein